MCLSFISRFWWKVTAILETWLWPELRDLKVLYSSRCSQLLTFLHRAGLHVTYMLLTPSLVCYLYTSIHFFFWDIKFFFQLTNFPLHNKSHYYSNSAFSKPCEAKTLLHWTWNGAFMLQTSRSAARVERKVEEGVRPSSCIEVHRDRAFSPTILLPVGQRYRLEAQETRVSRGKINKGNECIHVYKEKTANSAF